MLSLGHDSRGCLKERGVVRAVAVVISITGFVSLDSSVASGQGKGVPLFWGKASSGLMIQLSELSSQIVALIMAKSTAALQRLRLALVCADRKIWMV